MRHAQQIDPFRGSLPYRGERVSVPTLGAETPGGVPDNLAPGNGQTKSDSVSWVSLPTPAGRAARVLRGTTDLTGFLCSSELSSEEHGLLQAEVQDGQ